MKSSQQAQRAEAEIDHALRQLPIEESAGRDADASTRHRVAQSILEHGPSTASALSQRLGLTAAGVRRHLDVLTDHGQVVAREQRIYGARGRGRPARVFALTDTGRADFYQAYDDLAIKAIAALAQQAGPAALAGLGRQRIAGVARRYDDFARADAEPHQPRATPAEMLAAALSEEGYVASTQPSAAGEQLCQHHCPVAHVAEQFPQLCEAETELFSELLGVHVQRLATIAHGDGVCTTHIPRIAASAIPAPHEPTNDLPQTEPDLTQGRDQI